MGKYTIKKKENGASFNLVAKNGETIGVSEFYSSLDACMHGIESVKNNAPVANVEDQTVADFREQKHPKFVVYKDKADEFRFRLKAGNGQIILVSEGYRSKAACLNGIESVKKNADSEVAE
ncbi:MAG: YegP family protein [Erysipelotrichia bacterium]|nr:YegP family protein [Erysipelotrichia bacterium]